MLTVDVSVAQSCLTVRPQIMVTLFSLSKTHRQPNYAKTSDKFQMRRILQQTDLHSAKLLRSSKHVRETVIDQRCLRHDEQM